MSQFNFGNLESPLSGEDFINDNLEPWRDALHTNHSGSSRPAYAVAGMMWLDTTTNPWIIKFFTGSTDISIGTLNTSSNLYSPAGYTISAYIQTLLDDANASTARATLGLAIGTDVQAYNSVLGLLAGLTAAADKGIYFTGGSSVSTFTLTTAGRALLDDADVAAQWVTLGLGTAAGYDVGTGANDIVQLDGSGRLPSVDGSQLTGVGGQLIQEVNMNGTNLAVVPLDGLAYKSARIEFENMDCGGAFFMRLHLGGSEYTGSQYYSQSWSVTGASSGNLTGAYNSASTQGEWILNGPASDSFSGVLWLPHLAALYPCIHGQGQDSSRVPWFFNGTINVTASGVVTDFQVGRSGSNNFASGSKLRVYGYK